MLILIGLFIFGIFLEYIVRNKVPQMNRHYQLFYSFFFAVIMYMAFTWHGESMISQSGDAADIWQTITSFHTPQIYGSYVLYKGINSVYPYIWLYDLSMLLGINEWFFIKMFYCCSFAYVSAIGFPSAIELLTNKETKLYRRLIFCITMWYFGYYSMAYTQLMVDLPCLLYYILLINTALKLFKGNKSLWRYIKAGLLAGLCMTASGQYTMPAIFIILFVFLVTGKASQFWKTRLRALATRFIPCLLCVGLVIGTNYYFKKSVVEPLREEGAWIPSGNQWLQAGLARFNGTYRTGGFASSLPSYRNRAILNDYYGENLEHISSISISEYLQLFFEYPLDFILNYINSFFLILSPDHGSFNLVPLVFFYTLLYCALYIGFTKCKTWSKFFSPLFFISFSFLWATVPMLVMNIEPRTCLQIQGLIAALAICDETIWTNISKAIHHIRSNGIKNLFNKTKRICYPIIFYILFLCICLTHVATLYEMLGTDTQGILINLK